LDAILTTLGNILPSFLAIAGTFPLLGTGTTMVAVNIAAIPVGAFVMNNNPSLARCVLHARCVTRKPSRLRFYLFGILREFQQASPFALIVAGTCLFCFGISIVNLFFQH
jgi:hypothetical protein